jgi:hypothetical protein
MDTMLMIGLRRNGNSSGSESISLGGCCVEHLNEADGME